MTKTKAAVYVGVGAMLIAFLASAGSSPQDGPAASERPDRVSGTAGFQSAAAEIQSQAAKLRDRMAQAPAPRAVDRNPFAFATREPPRPAAVERAASVPEPEAPPAPAPMLSLVGVAEEASPEGLHRTAMIAGSADAFYMVIEGETFADRYRVTAIGQDAVELKDLTTGAYRRLALR